MNPEMILQIIKLSLEITLEVIRGIPLDSRQAMWREHEKRLQFWQDLFDRMGKPGGVITIPAAPKVGP